MELFRLSFVFLRDYFGSASLSFGSIILNGLNVSIQSREADRLAANELGFLTAFGVGVFLSINGGTIAGLI